MADPLDVQKTSIDRAADLLQAPQVRDIPTDVEVFGIVDGGFGPQGSVLFEVLFDVAGLVFNVKALDGLPDE